MFVKMSLMAICWAGLAVALPKVTANQKHRDGAEHNKIFIISNAANIADENTLLWKITGNGLKKPSYLFGTMHILCADDAVLSSNLKKAIRDCDEIYFEIDMDNTQEMAGAIKYLRMNDGVKLSELLTPEEYKKVDEYFKSHKVPLPLTILNRFKPMFISSLIGERLMDCEKKNGMEEQIMSENKKNYGKETRGLETLEYQASLFDSIPYEKQAKELVNYIDSMDYYSKSSQETLDVYRKQDLRRMDSLIKKSDPGMDEYMDILVYRRNRNWVKQMPGIMEGKTILFAVGAGHLPGDQGVINLLRKQGYKVEPLDNH